MKKLIAMLIFSFPFVLRAQTNTSFNIWNATLHLGPFASAVPGYLEETMKSQGYQPRSGGLFGNSGTIPMTSQGPIFQAGIEKTIQNSWSAKWLLSTLEGNVRGLSSRDGELRINYTIITSALLGGFYSKQRITRIAMGPSLHFIRLEGEVPFDSNNESIKKNHTKVGWTVEAGLRFPAKSLLFFDYNTQFHIVGNQNIGTLKYQVVDVGGEPYTTSFTAGKKSFNYLAFNFGLGVRLGRISK